MKNKKLYIGVTDIRSFWMRWNVVIVIALLKLLLHLLVINRYGLQRDEFLYFDFADHLMWGYLEVPPFVAFIAATAKTLLGTSLFAIRFFPVLAGVMDVVLIGMLVKEFKGSKWAEAIACSAFLLSPAFLGSNHLLQPVSFNQFWWLLSAYLIVKVVNNGRPRYWYCLGITMGLGILTKYSIAFFLISLLIGLLLGGHRHLFKTRFPYIATGIGIAIALPNIIWQINHGLPILDHMSDLRATQLVNVKPINFIIDQLLDQFAGSIIWLMGLIALLRKNSSLYPFRYLGFAFLSVILMIMILSGKSYYVMGAYPMLLAAGGVAISYHLQPYKILRFSVIPILLIFNAPAIPYGLPVLSLENMLNYGKHMDQRFGLQAPLRWEDGKIHHLRQDYADMLGWEEMVQKVARIFHMLPPEKQKKCMIYGGSYGHVAPVNYYRDKYFLPEAQSTNNSYIFWADSTYDFSCQILIDDRIQKESSYFEQHVLVDSIEHPYAREKGYIFLRETPRVDLQQVWKQRVQERLRELRVSD